MHAMTVYIYIYIYIMIIINKQQDEALMLKAQLYDRVDA